MPIAGPARECGESWKVCVVLRGKLIIWRGKLIIWRGSGVVPAWSGYPKIWMAFMLRFEVWKQIWHVPCLPDSRVGPRLHHASNTRRGDGSSPRALKACPRSCGPCPSESEGSGCCRGRDAESTQPERLAKKNIYLNTTKHVKPALLETGSAWPKICLLPGTSELTLDEKEDSQLLVQKKNAKTGAEAANARKPADPSKPTAKKNDKNRQDLTEAQNKQKAKSTAAALKTPPVRTAASPPESESFNNSSSKKRESVQKKLSFEAHTTPGDAWKGKADSPSATPVSEPEDVREGMQEQEDAEEEELEEDEDVEEVEPPAPALPKAKVQKTAAKSASKAKPAPRKARQEPREKQETKGVEEAKEEVSKKAQRKASALCGSKPEPSPEKGDGGGVANVLNRASTLDEVPAEDIAHHVKPDAKEVKKPKKGRDPAYHARKMRFYRSLDGPAPRPHALWYVVPSIGFAHVECDPQPLRCIVASGGARHGGQCPCRCLGCR